MQSTGQPAYWNEIRALLLAAMAIFVYTIVIGILNGTDLVDFDQRRILGHVHGGTLGWLTLAVFAAVLWLFGGDREPSPRERRAVQATALAAVIVFAAYVVAFSTTYGWWRPILGIAAVAIIVAVLGWVIWRSRSIVLGVPHWGILAAIATSLTGGVLGVLLGLQIATGDKYLPDDGIDAHPATMVVGFLTPIAFALSEWAFTFPKPPAANRLGITQMVLLFAGGLVLMTAILLGIDPLSIVAVLLQLIAAVIFFWRMWPRFRRVDWLAPTPERYGIVAAIFVAWVLGLAFYFAARYEGDFDLVPEHQLLALDHSQFIGAVTNAVFSMLMAATAARRWRRVDHLVFLLINVGIVGFAAGLLFDVTALKRVFAPIMGTGLLIGLGAFAWRLLPEEPAEGAALPEPGPAGGT